MGSQTLEVVRLGLWASLTGGWFYDPHQGLFTNTIHFYLWMFLVLLPFSLYLGTPESTSSWVWTLYCIVIGCFFLFVKFFNHRLHLMFDGEDIPSNGSKIEDEQSEGAARDVDANEHDFPPTDQDAAQEETIELQQIKVSSRPTDATISNTDTNSVHQLQEAETSQPLKTDDQGTAERISLNESNGNEKVSEETKTGSSQSTPSPVPALQSKDEQLEKLEIQPKKDSPEEEIESSEDEISQHLPPPKPPRQSKHDWNQMLNSELSPEDLKVENTVLRKRASDGLHMAEIDSQNLIGLATLLETTSRNLPFLLPNDMKDISEPLTKPAGSRQDTMDGRDPVLGAGCSSLYTEDGNPNPDDSTNTNSSVSSGLQMKDITRPGTPMPGRFSREGSSHGTDSRDATDILPCPLGHEDKDEPFSDTDVAAEGSLSLTRTGFGDEHGTLRHLRHPSTRSRHIPRRTPGIRRRRTREEQDLAERSSLLFNVPVMDHSGFQRRPNHLAKTHDDTSAGAVHRYEDEHGNIRSYVFQDSGDPLELLFDPDPVEHLPISLFKDHEWETSSASSALPELGIYARSLETSSDLSNPSSKINTDKKSRSTYQKSPPSVFKFKLLRGKYIRIAFDRLALLALFDRNKYVHETVLSVLLAILVSALGYWLLLSDFYNDFWIFVFCFVLAGCQFSLLKSVQPDAASPTHGFNHLVLFSRPVYFCILAVGVLVLDKVEEYDFECVTVYGVPLCSQGSVAYIKDVMLGFILAFPVIFLFGLLPQINTFVMYVLEQLEVHVFGGNASTSLKGAMYAFCRSVLAVGFLFGFCYGALKNPDPGQHILFSVFSGLLVALSYHLSRSVSDPMPLWNLIKSSTCCGRREGNDNETDVEDPLPTKLQHTFVGRVHNDLIICTITAVFVFGIHVSKIFTELYPNINYVFYYIAGVLGLIAHYLVPQLRKALPWLCLAHPVLRNREYNLFEVRGAAKVVWFEKVYVWLCFIERNIVYPCLFLSTLSNHANDMASKFGSLSGALIVCVVGLKMIRSSFSDSSKQFIFIIWTVLFFEFDYKRSSEGFPIDYFIMAIVLTKLYELVLKLRFVFSYIAPWQIPWGSAFHAFAQPFSIPHSTMMLFQTVLSSLISAPLNPFLGSAIFICSYVRPVKFWEKNYNTSRVDHSNTRLSTQLDRNPGADDNNLNSIFYEHLTRSLQHSLCGDLLMGRWGPVSSGDCFVLASDYLNALVHIIEVGNGLVTFQLRGLEFRGTYCQQREVEAITEDVESDRGCCCCHPGHLPGVLSVNAAFGQRWLAWQVTSVKYVVEGYSISDNSASSMLQVFDLRKILITYYVKAIIFYTVRSAKLTEWLTSEDIYNGLAEFHKASFVEKESTFNQNIDEDFEIRQQGVTRNSFFNYYSDWIMYCAGRRTDEIPCDKNSCLVTLCFALSLLGRRALGTASHQQIASLESFLFGLHALFKGDFRIVSSKDEWVLCDMDLLRKVVAPGVRMSLKLHQDHFTAPDEYDEPSVLYSAIASHEENLVIAHEGDPAWRQAVLTNRSSLLALRHVSDDGIDDYKIIMLNKRFLSFRVIKVNRECVRGLWAGQLQELIFLRNRNPERGSIQNAKQALRNIINSSCDQPIGYPIYVSPLTTSYADTNEQLHSFNCGPIQLDKFSAGIRRAWNRLRLHCGTLCQGSSEPVDETTQGTTSSIREYDVRRNAGSRRGRLDSSFSTPRTTGQHLSTLTNRTSSGSTHQSGSKLSSSLSVSAPSSALPSPASTSHEPVGGSQRVRHKK